MIFFNAISSALFFPAADRCRFSVPALPGGDDLLWSADHLQHRRGKYDTNTIDMLINSEQGLTPYFIYWSNIFTVRLKFKKVALPLLPVLKLFSFRIYEFKDVPNE